MNRLTDASWILLIVGLLALMWADDACGSEKLSLRVSKRVCLTPCEVTFIIHIPRHPDNRRWAVIWENANGIGGNSEQSLNGENSETQFFREAILTGGEWIIVARLLRITFGTREVTEVNTTIVVKEW